MTDWIEIITKYYQIIQNAVEMAKIAIKIRKSFAKEYTVDEIRDDLLNGELHFGDKIKLIGTFSEFVPFVDPQVFLTEKLMEISLPRTARLESIDDMYCDALFKPDQTDAFAEEVLPIFYGIDSQLLGHYTGEMLELNCQIMTVPEKYRNIINQNNYFSFEKEEGLFVPFGLKVLSAELYGLVDSFKINQWLIGKLDPAPHFPLKKERTCLNCANFFSYMTIDPVDWPPKYGCIHAKDEAKAKDLIESTERFRQIEKEAKPYVLFPNIFKKFEVFYPSVDILNELQINHSKNVLLGAIQENMEKLFQGYLGFEGLIIPKKSALTVDFQYDQVNKITKQTFDARDAPEWMCPHYLPDPKKIKKIEHLGEETDEFKIEKRF